ILQSVKEQKDALKSLRYQQVLRQIGNALGSIHLLLKQEQWRLQIGLEAVSVSAWVKRGLDRVAPLIKQSEILLEVNRETAISLPPGQVLSVRGDSNKLDLVLYELLAAACRRSDVGGKIEVSYQLLGKDLLELSVVDRGRLDRQLIAEFNNRSPSDRLVPVTQNQPLVQNLLHCQRLLNLIGGTFDIEISENNTIVVRLVLPSA
ncbi:MAG: histidine kinase, partial [Microcoleus sp.]